VLYGLFFFFDGGGHENSDFILLSKYCLLNVCALNKGAYFECFNVSVTDAYLFILQ
jgi:hypothetical protein